MRLTILQPISTPADLTHEQIQALSQNSLTITVKTLTTGPPSIESRVDTAFAIPEMIAVARREEQRGAQALVIDCMGDPGLEILREVVDIPVLGVTQTSMALCTGLADSFGIVTILDRTIPLIEGLVDTYGHRGRYVGCRAVDVPSLEIRARLQEVTRDLAVRALSLVRDDGAHAIVLGCTGFIGCADAIRERLLGEGFDVPVVDPLPATVFSAIPLVRLGLAQSRRSFPKYEAKQAAGYEFLEEVIDDPAVPYSVVT